MALAVIWPVRPSLFIVRWMWLWEMYIGHWHRTLARGKGAGGCWPELTLPGGSHTNLLPMLHLECDSSPPLLSVLFNPHSHLAKWVLLVNSSYIWGNWGLNTACWGLVVIIRQLTLGLMLLSKYPHLLERPDAKLGVFCPVEGIYLQHNLDVNTKGIP